VAALPGIVGKSVGLPDIHSGYGFAIGNMAAFDMAVFSLSNWPQLVTAGHSLRIPLQWLVQEALASTSTAESG